MDELQLYSGIRSLLMGRAACGGTEEMFGSLEGPVSSPEPRCAI